MTSSSSFAIQNLYSVENIIAVITGGGTGIGLAIAQALDANNAKAVYILGRRQNVLETAAKQAPNQTLIPIQCDVTSKESLGAAATRIRSEQGYIDTIFANSGIIGVEAAKLLPQGRKPTVKEFQDAMWKPSMEEFTQASHVNVTGVFYTAVAFLDLLDEGNKRNIVPQKSSIIITASISSVSRHLSAGFAYSSSKAGVSHLSKVLATYLAEYKIRVNAVAPGIFITEMTQDRPYLQNEPTKEGSVDPKEIPWARVGTPEEIAGATLFLMSNVGGYITGNLIISDGGRLSVQPGSY